MGDLDKMYSYEGLTAERTLVVMLHDLRTPVTSIVELSKLLLENSQTLTDDEQVQYLKTIQHYAEIVNTITDAVALSEQVLKLNK